MKRFLFLITCFSSLLIQASEDTFSEERITDFENDFTCQEKQELSNVNLTSSCTPGATTASSKPVQPPSPPGPPTPPTNPINPAPKNSYLPIVITNNTGLPASEVYVLFGGQQTVADVRQYFFALGKGGVLYPVPATSSTYSPNYSYPLTDLPNSSTGANDYLVYGPNFNGVRVYFSIKSPMYLQTDTLSATTNQIQPPTYFAFYDPNYNNLYETVELTFFPRGGEGTSSDIPWTASVNTTEVDAFGLPIKIGYFSYNPASPTAITPLIQNPNALPSGFGVGGASGSTTRSGVLNYVTTQLAAQDLTGAAVWPRLAIPFYSDPYAGSGLQTYLRVLSPKQSLGNAANPTNTGGLTNQHIAAVNGTNPTTFRNYNYPPFPADYLTATTYGDTNSFARDLFSYYTSGRKLYISTGGQTPTVYEGVTTGTTPNQVLTFTGISGPNTGNVCVLNQSDINTFKMYSGSQLMSGGADGLLLGFYLGDVFTVGFLPSPIGTLNSSFPPAIPINVTDAITWQPAFIPRYYTAQDSLSGGPWMDLYAKLLHSVAVRTTVSGDLNGVGLCYGYDFDDSLGISGTITPAATTLNSVNPYLGITLGAIDTTIPNPYSDTNTYTVTFTFPTSSSLQYQQGSGAWNNVTSGTPIGGLTSNSSNPLKIRYTNNQGPFAYHEYIVYLYYQFLQPVGSYNSSDRSVIDSTSITPNSGVTSFTINLLP